MLLWSLRFAKSDNFIGWIAALGLALKFILGSAGTDKYKNSVHNLFNLSRNCIGKSVSYRRFKCRLRNSFLPTGRIRKHLKKRQLAKIMVGRAAVFLAGVIGFVTVDVLTNVISKKLHDLGLYKSIDGAGRSLRHNIQMRNKPKD